MKIETLLASDLYQYTMSHVFYENKMEEKMAIFNMFFRKAPDNNGFAIVSGIEQVVEMILSMGKYEKQYYKKFLQDDRYDELCEYLSKTTFKGEVRAMQEGEIAWPNQPIITVKAPLIQGQILETPMLSILNHQMAIATKASRVVRSTKKPVSEFGTRRAHGTTAGLYGGKAAYIAGCVSTSNTLSKIKLNIPCTGTMAHSYVTAFGCGPKKEFEAFDKYIKSHKGETLIMLIDTYDTIKCGLKNAIKAFKENGIDDNYSGIYGVRLDSGDLTYLSKQCRKELDQAGFKKAIISATNGLDEYIIPALEAEGACIDMYGVGDAIATSKHNPCFGGVYKLVQIDNEPVIKLSEDKIKVTDPGDLVTLRIIDKKTKKAIADVTCLMNDATMKIIMLGEELLLVDQQDKYKETKLLKDSYSYYQLQSTIIADFVNIYYDILFHPEISRKRCKETMELFDSSHLRLLNPHVYKVNISDELYDLKCGLMNKIKEELNDIEE